MLYSYFHEVFARYRFQSITRFLAFSDMTNLDKNDPLRRARRESRRRKNKMKKMKMKMLEKNPATPIHSIKDNSFVLVGE